MLELIGIIVVAVVVWKVLKGVVFGGVKGHMMRSVDHAVGLGVPYEFASKMIHQDRVMKVSRDHIAKLNPDFRMKDGYQQNGETIAMLYQGYVSEKNKRKA